MAVRAVPSGHRSAPNLNVPSESLDASRRRPVSGPRPDAAGQRSWSSTRGYQHDARSVVVQHGAFNTLFRRRLQYLVQKAGCAVAGRRAGGGRSPACGEGRDPDRAARTAPHPGLGPVFLQPAGRHAGAGSEPAAPDSVRRASRRPLPPPPAAQSPSTSRVKPLLCCRPPCPPLPSPAPPYGWSEGGVPADRCRTVAI